MIKAVYTPLELDGMEYNRFGFIIVIDRQLFIKSLAEQIGEIDLNALVRDASDKNEMNEIIKEAIELSKQIEIFE